MPPIRPTHSDTEDDNDSVEYEFDQSDFEDDDDDYQLDITESLANPSSSTNKPTKAQKTDPKRRHKQQDEEEDEEDDDDEAFIRASAQKANFKAGAIALKSRHQKNQKSNTLTGGGSFQSLGLHPALLRAILLRGFTTPTPIQRAVLPHILASPARDVVGMARTGSGKTLAYLIPLIHKLGGRHNVLFGVRALVMVPTRELAVQVLKVGKDLAKGFVQGGGTQTGNEEEGGGKGEGLRWGLIVGGDSLEEQFAMFASNPDVIIATPGRLLHLAVEMNLDLKSVQYIVFDEADRLFEMGFETQLHETLSRLPHSRQTLLFSATLPKTLVEFAKAGLQNPKLVRLDSESKISSDLQMGFLSIKPNEKDAGLLVILADVIGVPKSDGTEIEVEDYEDHDTPYNRRQQLQAKRFDKKSSKGKFNPNPELAPHQTIVFAATKHHVEYLTGLLVSAGYRVSHIYGALDQAARRNQLNAFRAGRTNILVVTDLAARGIDIPILENVINYDFPSSARAFVHRVGRTARAGRKGWAYSLVTQTELPYLMDLQLFLSRPLLTCPLHPEVSQNPDFSANLVLGTLPRERLDSEAEYVRETLVGPNSSLVALTEVVRRAQKMYIRSQSTASAESYRRSKALVLAGEGLTGTSKEEAATHPIFGAPSPETVAALTSKRKGPSRDELLAKVNKFTPTETVFEIGTRGKSPAAQLMRDRRKSMGKVISKRAAVTKEQEDEQTSTKESYALIEAQKSSLKSSKTKPSEVATEVELEDAFEMPRKRKKSGPTSYKDPEVYLTYEQDGAAAEKGYNLNEGTAPSFVAQANAYGFDLGADDEGRFSTTTVQKASQVRWDRRTKKFVKSNQGGTDNVKLVKTESGAKLPASFKSGVFDDWQKKEKVRIPNVGETEMKGRNQMDYRPTHTVTRGGIGGGAHLKGKKGKGRPGQSIRNAGLKNVEQIRKERDMKDRRKQRSNQPSRKKR
ncbi:uncharacterized protein MELLADRAFT_32308 [Melampsora larici-populina 98AG31]|uniref:RNA helicase n=1 Tax=Melampsora larici-populina (strain 98AG31 / pathotype 3-4-7) TaxID=747676 RepID=F4R3S4_MELLP|nr:uncharacterized protein MELLADRAFT_32308 [Melampsora larici-populina 98AG31]EGG13117.1 hypothetical protein MELLADRAFT_32308 [Melampsora larici-populina 98AG31]